MTVDFPALKKQARSEAKARRDAFQPAADARQAFAALRFPVDIGPSTNCVSGFYPYQSEADILPLLGRLAGEGWTTALPVIEALGKPLFFRRWFPGEPTIAGKWNIPIPLETAELVVPDVVLVPLLAFDRLGQRLGYGGGFYDRTLEALRAIKPVIAIGIAYAVQEAQHVPHDDFDQRLDFVMTEREVIRCG